ncbi:MAG TPA: AI-2E family transporter [Burkholderiales bacterium]|nr:AI-2E family transporter [Burkholderiales bacterium]
MSAIPVITERQARYAAIIATLAGLFLALYFGLIGALLAGLLVHELVQTLAARLPFGKRTDKRARLLSVGLISALVIGALVAVGFAAAALLRSEGASPAALLARMADIVASSRASLPAWISERIPADADALRVAIVDWLRSHSSELQYAGRAFMLGLVHVLIGMVIGAIICFRQVHAAGQKTLLLREGGERMKTLGHAFRGVVFAQVKISAINTVLTAIYLVGVLPLLGIELPYAKALVAVTFFAGLLPVVGNLISNTVIVVVSLSQSFVLAVGSLAFLVVIHKLEYFLNARIVGGEIKASAWELLCAMLLMEAVFGLPGLLAAPIFYAYIKAELRQLELI